MNIIQRAEHWGDTHHPAWMDIVRIALGGFLVFKGISFLTNMSALIGLMSTYSFGDFALILLGHGVVFIHIVGGILLMLGVLTRFACLIQIPVLIGAVIILNFAPEAMRPYSEVLLSILVLLLLVYFLVAGNGPWALKIDNDHQKEKTWKI